MEGSWFLFVCVAIATAQCPWETYQTRWSQMTLPLDVVIGAGQNVLFDSTNAVVTSITITAGGRLVWANLPNLSLDVHWIVVDNGGKFELGSEACPITEKTTITLSGLSTDPLNAPLNMGNKVIGVGAGGTWEVHGKLPRPTWAKLSRTVYGTLPEWSSDSSLYGRGTNVVTIDPLTGVIGAQLAFDTYGSVNASNALAEYIDRLPNGTVVIFSAYDAAQAAMTEKFKLAAETLGSTHVRQVGHRQPWGLIGIKNAFAGQPIAECWNSTAETRVSCGTTFQFGALFIQGQVTSAGWGAGAISMSFSTYSNTDFTKIALDQPVDWQVGDHIAIASTDFDYRQSEERVLVACADCAPNEVRIDSRCKYMHYGEITWGVDERAEVGLLSRKIVIQGNMEPACYGSSPGCAVYSFDTWGGHTRVLRNFTSVHIEGAEFYHMGQTVVGSYPIHFHMCHDVDNMANPPYVKHNSVHHSFDRCVTIHGTNGLLVEDNFAFDHMGHCYFFEDGAEMRNVLNGNVGLVTRPGYVLPSDRNREVCQYVTPTDFDGNPIDYTSACTGVTTFWVTNPNNILVNNVAGGSDHFGFWYIFPDHPQGLSFIAYGTSLGNLHTLPFGVFENNTAHSNGENGLFLDDTIQSNPPSASSYSPFPQFSIVHAGRYKPRSPANSPDPRKRTLTVWTRFTTYKNRNRGVWVRGGEHRFYHFKSADNQIGATFASEGAMPNEPGSTQDCYDCLFVGQTDNKGTFEAGQYTGEQLIYNRGGYVMPGYLTFPMRGYEVYDGPTTLTHARFYRFWSHKNRNASAVGYLLNDNWQLSAHNNITLARFGEGVVTRVYHGRENEDWFGRNDGARNQVVTSRDGSLDVSGIPGSLVNWTPFFHTSDCVAFPHMQAQRCPMHFGQLFIYNNNQTGTNFIANANLPSGAAVTKSEMTLVRDERSTFLHKMWTPGAFPGDGPNMHMPLVIYGKSYTIHYSHPTPNNIKIDLVNFDQFNFVRIGICIGVGHGPQIEFLVRNNSNNVVLTRVYTSVADVDSDPIGRNYYFDVTRGLLFVKAVARIGRIDNYYCPLNGNGVRCEGVTVQTFRATAGISGDCTASAYPFYARTEPTTSTPQPDPPLPDGTGLLVTVAVKLTPGYGVGDGYALASDLARITGTPTTVPRFAVTNVNYVSAARAFVDILISPPRVEGDDESVEALWARVEPLLDVVNSALKYTPGQLLNRWTSPAYGVSSLQVEFDTQDPPTAASVTGLVACWDGTMRLECPPEPSDMSQNVPIIAGAVGGVVVLAVLAAVVCVCRRRSTHENTKDMMMAEPMASTSYVGQPATTRAAPPVPPRGPPIPPRRQVV